VACWDLEPSQVDLKKLNEFSTSENRTQFYKLTKKKTLKKVDHQLVELGVLKWTRANKRAVPPLSSKKMEVSVHISFPSQN
jgi:hypothetical protein